jgi:hypothetical protein
LRIHVHNPIQRQELPERLQPTLKGWQHAELPTAWQQQAAEAAIVLGFAIMMSPVGYCSGVHAGAAAFNRLLCQHVC